MATGILGIAVSGLNAAQAGLAVTSHNIANASTDGFHRQTAIQATQFSQPTGSGFFGRGVVVDTVLRSYSQFLDGAVLTAQTQQSYLDTYGAQISQLDNMLADPNSGLSPSLQSFFSAVQDVATNPSSVPSRQQMISAAQTMVARFQTFDSRFEEIRKGINSQLVSVVGSINAYTRELAEVNDQITRQQTDPSQPPNDLLDQRDALIAKINGLVKTTTITQSDGSVNVFIGNGQSLVVGAQNFTLSAQPMPEDPENLGVYYQSGATSVRIPERLLQGGTVSALLDFRAQLNSVQNQVGRVATVLAYTFNDQHHLGQDLAGNLGGDFFAEPSAKIVANQTNTGTGVLSVAYANVGALTTSDYRLSLSGATYTLTRLADNTQTTFATFPQTIDGMTISLASGTVSNGDDFLIQPTRVGARDIGVALSDTTLIAAAAPVRTSTSLSNSGSATISPGVVTNTANPAFATAGALTPPILIRFTTPTTYSVFNNTNPAAPVLLEGGITYNPAASNAVFPTPGALDYGYRISLSGAAATGDSFTVNYNSGGVADNRNALLLAALQTANTVANGTTSYQGAYSQMVSDVGNKANEVQIQSKGQDALVRQTISAQQSLSGVNLDEEAANLLRFQQAYQASSKVIAISGRLFDDILAAIG
ncbi:MAG: flagellar hook-associated protein FlgK [Burkholderiales bacterium]